MFPNRMERGLLKRSRTDASKSLKVIGCGSIGI